MAFDPSTIADAKKLTLSQDGTDVDADLTDFPVTVIPPATWAGYSALADDIHANTVLLVNSDTTDESTTFEDTSGQGHTVTAGGSVKHDDAQTIAGGSTTIYFNGTTDYLSLSTDTDFQFGTGDFTICGWFATTVKSTDPNSRRIVSLDSSATGLNLYVNSVSGALDLQAAGGIRITGATDITDGNAHHFELSRSSGTTKLFVDGTQEGSSYSDSNNYSCASTWFIGKQVAANGYFNGVMQGIQFIKGTALHTAAFTPPTALIHQTFYKKISIDINGTQTPIEVSPTEWEDWVAPTNHYTMDDITGSTLTDEMGDTDGTITNMTQTATGALADSGYYLAGGNCASVAKYIALDSRPITSIVFWFRRVSLTNWTSVLWKSSSAYIDISDNVYGTANTIFSYNGTYHWSNLTVTDTNWHQMAVGEGTNSSSFWVYLDGVKSSGELATGYAGVVEYLGRSVTGADAEAPDLDNVQVYASDKLTDAQIARLYAAQSQYYHPGRQAVLHTKIPSLLAASGFEATLSYDETADDNSTYVDIVGTTVAEGVYNSNYLTNWTMAQDPSGSAPQLTDSTSNDKDGTATGTMTSADLVAGTIGMGIDFDGTDDSFTFSSNLGVTSYPFAYISRFEVDNLSTAQPLVSGDDASNYIGLTVWIDTNGAVNVRLGDGTGTTSADHYTWKTANSVISATTEYTLSLLVTNFTTVTLYIDGAAETLSFSAGTGASADLTNASYRLGACAADSTFLDGKIYHSFFYAATISANFAEIVHLCLTDAFLTWSAYTSFTDYTATAGNGYAVESSTYRYNIKLPATPSAGDQVGAADYSSNFTAKPSRIDPNGGKIQGSTDPLALDTDGDVVELTYIDSTQGWVVTG